MKNITRNGATIFAALAAAALLAWPAPRAATAQDALGSGNALDANLSSEGTTNQRAYQEDFRARNLVVTNNVPGGRGFRGSVGYTAENDFRGVIGSDDLYSFRADAAFSAPAFVNYGRTYEQLRFGRELAALEFSRDFQGANLRQIESATQTPRQGELIDARMRLDRISRSSQSLGVFESAPSGDIVGTAYDKDGNVLIARASSLYGINMTPAESDAQAIGLTLYDMARIREQAQREGQSQAQMIGKPFEPAFDEALDPFRREVQSPNANDKLQPERAGDRIDTARPGERVDTREADQRLHPGSSASYRDVLRRVVERYADRDNVSLNIDPSIVEEFEAEYQQLRKELRGTIDRKVPTAVPAEPEETEDEATEPATPTPTKEDAKSVPGVATPLPSKAIPDRATLSEIDQLAGALRHGQRIAKLSSDDASRFNELVSQAEKALREGEFFIAERRFDRALRFNPGHPLATAGMGHAQIGSGLYLSAALTLRNLLASNPEMIDVVYDPGLIPARGRLESAITTLRQRIEKQQDVPLNGFLLAYIGKLLGDHDLMLEGLNDVAEVQPDDALQKLLRAIWLNEPASKNAPAGESKNAPAKPASEPQK